VKWYNKAEQSSWVWGDLVGEEELGALTETDVSEFIQEDNCDRSNVVFWMFICAIFCT